MRQIFSENFDGVTAGPSVVPSSLTIVNPVGTYGTTTSKNVSGPNSLYCTIGGGGGRTDFVSNVPASLNSSCVVSASFYTDPGYTDSRSGFFIGVGAATEVNWYQINFPLGAGQSVFVYRNGTFLGQAPSSTGSYLTSGIWYTLTVWKNYAQFTAAVQRLSDNNWLTSGGVWQSAYASVGSILDSSPLADSQIYCGLALQGQSFTIYVDNFTVSDMVLPKALPSYKIKGMNIGWLQAAGELDPTYQWYNIVTGGFTSSSAKPQIDLAKSVGCNCIRFGLGMSNVSNYEGRQLTMSQYLSSLGEIITYCKKKGMFYIHREDAYIGTAINTQVSCFAYITANWPIIAQFIAQYPNVIGFDMINEYVNNFIYTPSGNVTMTSDTWDQLFWQLIPAIRAVAPNLNLSSSTTILSAPVNSYQFDYVELHNYNYAPLSSDATGYYGHVGTGGKPFLITETGGAAAQSAPTALQVMDGGWTNLVQASYTGGPGCSGLIYWDALPIGDSNQMWDTAGGGAPPYTLRSDIGPTFTGYTVNFPFFSSFRRRRR